jgi:hypothetical protein
MYVETYILVAGGETRTGGDDMAKKKTYQTIDQLRRAFQTGALSRESCEVVVDSGGFELYLTATEDGADPPAEFRRTGDTGGLVAELLTLLGIPARQS